jgi:periplasmic divalent cation tolerance protein
MEELIIVYVTASNKEEAVKIGEGVVKKRLAACANIVDNLTAIYRWEGEVQKDNEAVLLLKTKSSLFPELEKEIKELHSYSCPCIIGIPLSRVNSEYAEWVVDGTK